MSCAPMASSVLKHHHQHHLYQTPQSPLPYPTSEHSCSSYDHPSSSSLQQQYPFSPLPHRTTQLSPGKTLDGHTNTHHRSTFFFFHSHTHHPPPFSLIFLSDFSIKCLYDYLMFFSGLAFFSMSQLHTFFISLSLSYTHMDTHFGSFLCLSCVSFLVSHLRGWKRRCMGWPIQCLKGLYRQKDVSMSKGMKRVPTKWKSGH